MMFMAFHATPQRRPYLIASSASCCWRVFSFWVSHDPLTGGGVHRSGASPSISTLAKAGR